MHNIEGYEKNMADGRTMDVRGIFPTPVLSMTWIAGWYGIDYDTVLMTK